MRFRYRHSTTYASRTKPTKYDQSEVLIAYWLMISMDSYIRSLKRGILRGYILYVLNKPPNAPKGLCGIEIIQKARQNLELKLGSGTLYPILHEMEARGVIIGKWDVSGGIRKKYYRLTDKGRLLLIKFCKQLKRTVTPLLQMETPIYDFFSQLVE